jgi:hypothetical protein
MVPIERKLAAYAELEQKVVLLETERSHFIRDIGELREMLRDGDQLRSYFESLR